MIIVSVIALPFIQGFAIVSLWYATRARQAHKRGQFRQAGEFRMATREIFGFGIIWFVLFLVAIAVAFVIQVRTNKEGPEPVSRSTAPSAGVGGLGTTMPSSVEDHLKPGASSPSPSRDENQARAWLPDRNAQLHGVQVGQDYPDLGPRWKVPGIEEEEEYIGEEEEEEEEMAEYLYWGGPRFLIYMTMLICMVFFLRKTDKHLFL